MDETRIGRIIFRAWRRGFREADLILGPFAEKHVRTFSGAELDAFEILLAEDDHDLFAWISGKRDAPAELQGPMLERLRDFQRSLPIASGDISGL